MFQVLKASKKHYKNPIIPTEQTPPGHQQRAYIPVTLLRAVRGAKLLKKRAKRKSTASLSLAKCSSEGRMKMYFALRYSMMILCKVIPTCAESFCVQACCNAPQRQFDLQTRCFTKIITICMEVACDKNENIPK